MLVYWRVSCFETYAFFTIRNRSSPRFEGEDDKQFTETTLLVLVYIPMVQYLIQLGEH